MADDTTRAAPNARRRALTLRAAECAVRGSALRRLADRPAAGPLRPGWYTTRGMRLTRGHIMRGLAALLLTGVGVAGAQTTEQRLSRVAADVFSPAARVDADIAELKSILAADPRSAEAHMLLGIAYRTKGTSDLLGEATGELRQAIDLDPSLIPARLYLAHLYLDLARPERARDELQSALTQMPGQPQLQALLGECQRQLGKPDEALELTAQALKGEPSLAEARYYRGLALYDLKRRDEAIAAFEQVLQDGGTRPEVYASLGRAYLDAGRLDEAIARLDAGIHLDPSRPDLLIPIARAYRLKGQLAQAETWITRARSVIPPGAVSAAEQEVQRDLNFEDGVIRLKQRQLQAAARRLRQAVDLDPTYGPGYRYLAEVYLRQGLYARALDQASRAEKLGSPLPDDLQKTLQQKAGRPKGIE
jgi:tetratricopeptide (TPR) repeat protein